MVFLASIWWAVSAVLPPSSSSLPTATISEVAASLNADHVTYELAGAKQKGNLAHRGVFQTDPYKWDLMCQHGDYDDNWMSFTDDCRWEYHFKCKDNGHMTWTEDNKDCHKHCACYVSILPPLQQRQLSAGQVVANVRV